MRAWVLVNDGHEGLAVESVHTVSEIPEEEEGPTAMGTGGKTLVEGIEVMPAT